MQDKWHDLVQSWTFLPQAVRDILDHHRYVVALVLIMAIYSGAAYAMEAKIPNPLEPSQKVTRAEMHVIVEEEKEEIRKLAEQADAIMAEAQARQERLEKAGEIAEISFTERETALDNLFGFLGKTLGSFAGPYAPQVNDGLLALNGVLFAAYARNSYRFGQKKKEESLA